MLVVHIGLPKTATTTLQRHVFPAVASMVDNLEFNQKRLLTLCQKAHLLGLSEEEHAEFRGLIGQHENTLISLESLVSWNPREWEGAAEKNLELFGQDAVIVITLREPKAYLSSVWYQMMHLGMSKEPERFFLRAAQYAAIEPLLRKGALEYFDVDAFSYRRLCEFYENRFRRVHVVTMDQLENFRFLQDIFALSEQDREELQGRFQNVPRANVGYSALAIRLTFARQRFLERFGLRVRAVYDREPLDIHASFDRPDESVRQRKRFKDLTTIEKLLEIPRRGLNHAAGALKWRRCMQGGVNKLFPYRKYAIPDSCLDSPAIRESEEFLRTIERRHGSGTGG